MPRKKTLSYKHELNRQWQRNRNQTADQTQVAEDQGGISSDIALQHGPHAPVFQGSSERLVAQTSKPPSQTPLAEPPLEGTSTQKRKKMSETQKLKTVSGAVRDNDILCSSIKFGIKRGRGKPINPPASQGKVQPEPPSQTPLAEPPLEGPSTQKRKKMSETQKLNNARQRKKNSRANDETRQAEQMQDKTARATARQNPEKRKIARAFSQASMKRARHDEQRRSQEVENQSARRRQKQTTTTFHDLLQQFYKNIAKAPSYTCSCCGGLWYIDSTSKISKADLKKKGRDSKFIRMVLQVSQEIHRFCKTCKRSIDRNCIPKMCLGNGFAFPAIPDELATLSPLEERLIALRLPFMQIKLLGSQRQSSLKGNVVNVENNLDVSAKVLPRNFDSTSTVQVQLMRRMRYKTPYMHETIKPLKVYRAAHYLAGTELYQAENVVLSDEWSRRNEDDEIEFICNDSNATQTHNQTDTPEEEQQTEDVHEHLEEVEEEPPPVTAEETLIYTDVSSTDQSRVRLAPAEGNTPLSLIHDANAEALSFPTIYCGMKRSFEEGLKISYTDIAKSELRRYDRRCSRPSKILYAFKRSYNEKVAQAMQICVRKRSKGQGCTVASMLDPTFLQQLIAKDGGYSVFKKLRSSPPYLKEKVKTVLAMIRQLGYPTFFITLSAAETKWLELVVILKKIVDNETITQDEAKLLSYDEVADLIRKDPVTCMRHFDHRFRLLLNTLLKHKAGIFSPYELQDYFTRLEFQMRGSPHDHGLYWIKDAPLYIPGDAASHEACTKFIDQFITCEREDPDIHEYLSYQLHKHSHTCRKSTRLNQKCRFGYPLAPMDKTMILTPLPKSLQQGNVRKASKNAALIRERLDVMGRDFNEKIPFEDFIGQLSLSREEYLLALRSSIRRTTVFLKRSTNAIFINAYNKKLLQAWGANLDIQFIVDPYACAKYCVGYMLKSEGGLSNLLRKASEDIRRGNTSAQDKLKKFANVLVNGSEISAQEAVAFILGISNTSCSKSDVFINTGPPEDRVGILKSENELLELSPESEEVCQAGLLDHYIQRPTELEEVFLAQFASMYDFSKRTTFSQQLRPDDESSPQTRQHETNSTLQLNDGSGFIRKRRTPKIIRYRHYGEASDPVNYFREQLMLYIPWRDEELELLSIKTEEVYKQKLPQIQNNAAAYVHSKDVHEHLFEEFLDQAEREENDNDDSPLIDDELEALEIRETYHADISVDLHGTQKSCGVQSFLAPKMVTIEDYTKLMRSLNEKQRRFVLDILHLIKTQETPFYRFLSGGAGVGKSHVIFALVQSVMRFVEQQVNFNPEEVAVLVSAPTGKAAFNVFGMTLHCTFKLPPTQYAGRLCDLDDGVVNSLRVKLHNIKLFIIDEISMCNVKQFYDIDQRLRQIFATDVDFGGKSMIVVGHLRQLPPIPKRYVFEVPRHLPLGYCTGNYLWERFFLYELDEIMRQKGDALFCKALNNMSEGCMDAEDIALFRSREVTDKLQPPPDAIRLFHTNAQCSDYNKNVHERLNTEGVVSTAYDKIQGRGSMEEKEALREYAKTLSLQESDGLPNETQLQIGAEYFVSTNIDVEDGLFNGSTGRLEKIECKQTPSGQKFPVCAYIDFRIPMVGSNARGKHKSHSVINKINLTWTPIHRSTRTLKRIRNNKFLEVVRQQIPLIAANGVTVAKAQGSSYFCGVVLKPTGYKEQKLSRELLYTGCSRATSSDGLFIDGTFEAPDPPPPNDLVTIEMLRLRQMPYPFKLRFLQDYDESYEKLYYHNIQSFGAHVGDVGVDQCCVSSNQLAFVEPHLLEQDTTTIPGFTALQRRDCTFNRNSEGSLVFVKSELYNSIQDVKCYTYRRTNATTHCLMTTWTVSGVTILLVYKSPAYSISSFIQQLVPIIRRTSGNILLVGDTNIDLRHSEGEPFVTAMNETGLTSALDLNAATTNGGSTIDCCFTNFVNISAWNYESYYSYHKPICVVWKKS